MVERLVAFLIPPSHREHVLGDLAERSLSPLRYAAEAVRLLPFVVASQVRRTSSLAKVAGQTFMLLAGFRAGSDGGFFSRESLIPTLAGVAALALHDAYASAPLSRPSRRIVSSVLAVTAAAFASQFLLRWLSPELAMTWKGAGGRETLLGILILQCFAWRGEVPADQLVPLVAGADRSQSVEEIYNKLGPLETGVQRSIQLTVEILILTASAFAVHAWLAPNAVVSAGRALASAATVIAAGIIAHSDACMPRPATFHDFVGACRARVERQRLLLPKFGWVIFLPLFPAQLMIYSNGATSVAALAVSASLATAGLFLMGLAVGRVAARGLDRHIQSLTDLQSAR